MRAAEHERDGKRGGALGPGGGMHKRIQSEFSRQARQMDSAPAFRSRDVVERLADALGSSASGIVLDLACGPGIVAKAIAPRVREVVGIDLTAEMIMLANERFKKAGIDNGSFSVAAAENLPFERACFDQVVTRLSFHHFPDIARVLAELRRVMRTGGRLIVADVVSSEVEEEARLHNALERLRDPTHVRMLSSTELVKLIERAGFSVEDTETWAQQRAFTEWAAIIADERRTGPLEHVMRVLARAGNTAGIGLREEDGELRFTHTWALVVARAGMNLP